MTDKTIILCDEQGNEIDAITIPECEEMREKKEEFLDISKVIELGVFTNENANLFKLDEENKKYYNLLCVIVDRLKTAAEYLNKHCDVPENEEQFLLFLVYACMIHDAIKELNRAIYGNDGSGNEKIFFKDICMNYPWYLDEDECLTDDEFFEHFRSLAFAHPYKTNHRKSIREKFGIQYSPWIIASSEFHKGKVGLIIYSEKDSRTQNLMLDFSILKNYIRYRYEKISDIIKWFKNRINDRNQELLKKKIIRSDCPIETLANAIELANHRFYDFYGNLELLMEFLKYENKVPENEECIAEYKDAIKSIIPELCDMIDEGKVEEACKVLDKVLYTHVDERLAYCRTKISDAYFSDSIMTWMNNKVLINENLKMLRLQLRIDDSVLSNMLACFVLVSAICYAMRKEADNEPI